MFQFSQFSTVLITTNLDGNTGEVNLTGFTTGNTKEIEFKKDSLDIQQAVVESFIESSNLLDTETFADKLSNFSVPEGHFNITTYFTTSAQGPHIQILWNSLLSNYVDTSFSGYSELNIFRTANTVPVFGLIIISDGITYVIDNCRIQSAALEAPGNDFMTVAWAGNFTSLRMLGKTTLEESGEVYNLTGALTGKAYDDKLSYYTLCMPRLAKVGIAPSGSANPEGYIAFSDFTINIVNELLFIENNGIDRQSLKQIFVGSKKFDINGNATAYTRGVGYVHTLLNHILEARNPSPSLVNYRQLYKLFIYLKKTDGSPLADIVIDGLSMTASTNIGQIYSNTFGFKLSETPNSSASAIKFYH